MINLSARLSHPGAPDAPASAANKGYPVSSQLFARRHPARFREALTDTGSDSELANPPASSQPVATRQVPAAVTPGWVSRGFGALVPSSNPTAPATPPTVPAANPNSATGDVIPNKLLASTLHWYASDPFDDAYWAKQPPAVQQLREIDDVDQRTKLAASLTAQGYVIDVPIMVWGWDAGKVTQLRQSYGYTWVPSAGQQPVTAAPGLTGPGITPYDPAHPPKGSIQV